MKKLLIILAFIFSITFVNAQLVHNNGGFTILTSSDNIINTVKSDVGTLLYSADYDSGLVVFKTFDNQIISTSSFSVDSTECSFSVREVSQTMVDSDLGFEIIVDYSQKNGKYFFTSLFDDDGTELLRVNNPYHIFFESVNDKNYLFIDNKNWETGIHENYSIELNGLAQSVYDTVHVISHDTIVNQFDTTITTIDTIFVVDSTAVFNETTYLNTSYLSEFEKVQLTSSDEMEKLETELTVYPNPATTSINIDCDSKFMSFEMIEISSGRIVYSGNLSSISTTLYVDDMGLENGTYNISLTDWDGNTIQKKIIITGK